MAEYDTWRPWPIWSAVWVGALAAIAVGLIIGLIGFAVGAHELAAPRFTTWNKVRFITAIFNIGGAFFAFVVGGWIAARIAGLRRAEPAMLHGGVVWLVAIPFLLVLAALGATSHWGGWYGALGGSPAWVTAVPPVDPWRLDGLGRADERDLLPPPDARRRAPASRGVREDNHHGARSALAPRRSVEPDHPAVPARRRTLSLGRAAAPRGAAARPLLPVSLKQLFSARG
jgi:hypothetical protein